MKGIVLLSGGLDSTLALVKLLEQGHEVTPMFVDYNQWSLEGELEATYQIDSWLRKKEWTGVLLSPLYLRLRWQEFMAPTTNEGDMEGRVGSAWGRNIALVGLAAMWAYTHGNDYDFIALGSHRGDVGPDCKPGGFDHALNTTLFEATKGRISLSLPIRELVVEDIGRELAEFGIPWSLTYSCYWGTPCGYRSPHDSYRCPGCRRKTLAMRAGGARPEELLLPNCKELSYQSPLAEELNY